MKVVNGKDIDSFNKKYYRSIQTQGREKLWNYFLDLVKTDKFQKQIKKFREDLKKEKSGLIWDDIALMMTAYGFDGYAWDETMHEYIYENKLVKPEGVDMCKIMSISELEDELEENETESEYRPHRHYARKLNLLHNFPIVMLINPKATLRDIEDFIRKNYNLTIKESLKPAFDFFEGQDLRAGKSKKKNKMVQERNNFIFENKTLNRKVLQKLVSEKFGWDNTIDVAYIGKIIRQETKKRN